MRRDYAEMIAERQARYPGGIGRPSFDPSELAPQFVPFFESGERIRIRTRYGEEVTGTVGVTTGWVPTFLLMRRSSDIGSSWILTHSTEVVAVQRGRRYEDVTA